MGTHRSDNFVMGDLGEFWVHPTLLYNGATPTQRTLISAGGTIAANATSITLTTASTSKLYDQQRIRLAGGGVIVINASAQTLDTATDTRFFNTGATTINIYPPTTAVTMAASEPYVELMPLHSCKNVTLNAEGQIQTFRNLMSGGAFSAKQKAAMDVTASTDGYTMRTDTMLDLMRQAALDTKAFLFFRGVSPDGKASWQATGQVSSLDISYEDGSQFMTPFQLALGAPTLVDLRPS